MIDDSCEVPREDLDDGFNPCRKQVVENGELCQYAHMYDVMNERYDREEDTSYLNSVKRDRISQSTPSQNTGGGKIYSQDTNGIEGFISTSGTLEPTTDAEIPSSKAVADYVAGAIADYAPNPLPVDHGGTGAQTAQGALANLFPRTTSGASATGALVYDVDSNSTYLRAISGEPNGYLNDIVNRSGIQAMIDAHSMDTPPHKFYYAVSPFLPNTWEGEMIINVTPVFSVKIGAVTYVLARVYSYKKFIYTGTADNIKLFTSLKPVGDYTGVFSDSTRIPLTFNVFGRSNTDGEYGLTSKGSAANLSLNYQTVNSVFNLGNFDISSNLKCVFGEGSNTPAVAVSVDCVALMWNSES